MTENGIFSQAENDMDTILFLISNTRDRRLLQTYLQGRYRIVVPEKEDEIDCVFDLCISDSAYINRKYETVAARKKAENEVFLPVLLVTTKKEVGQQKAVIPDIIDEIILRPIQEMELHARVTCLLRIRSLTTEQKRHKGIDTPRDEKTFLEEHEFSNAILESMPGVFYLYDENFRFMRWNKNFEKVTGYTGTEISRMSPLDFFAGEEKALLAERIQEVFNKGASSVEANFVSKDGTCTPYYLTGNRCRVGGKTCLIGMGIDISERKEVEEKFYTIFQVSPTPMTITRISDGRFIDVNVPFLDVFEFSRDEVIGRTSTELNILSLEARGNLIRRQIASGGLRNDELLARSKSGRPIHLLFSSKPVELGGEAFHITTLIDISDLKAAETALRESEERLRLSTELAHVAVWEYDFANNSMARSKNHDLLYGLEWQDTWAFETFLNATHPEDRDFSTKIIQESVAPGGPDHYTFDFRTIHPDQSIHWLSVTGQVVQRDATGRGILVRGCIFDISDRKLAELDLKASEIKFRSFFQNSMDAILLTVPDGSILSANPAAIYMFGFSEEELCKVGRAGVVDVGDPRLKQLLERRATTGRVFGEMTMVRKNGTRFPAEISSALFRDAQGFQRSSMIIRDITESKQSIETIAAKERFISGVVNTTPAIIYVYDMILNSNIYVNNGMDRLLGYSQEQIKTMGEKVLGDLIHPEDISRVMDFQFEILGASENETLSVEYRMKHHDGHWVHLHSDERVFQRDKDGKVAQKIGVAFDITERKQVENKRIEAERRYRRLFENMNAGFVLFEVVQDDKDVPIDLIIVAANKGFEMTTGLEQTDLIGKRLTHVLPGIEKDAADWIGTFGKVAITGESRHFEQSSELLGYHYTVAAFQAESKQCAVTFIDITPLKRTENEIRRRAEELEALNTLGRKINQSLSLDETVSDAIAETLRIAKADLAILFLREGDEMRMAGFGPRSEEPILDKFPSHRVGECICGLAVSQHRSIYSQDIFQDARCTWQECKQAGLRSLAALPLGIGEEIIGVLGLAGRAERDFQQQAALLETLAGQIAAGLNNAILHEKIQKHAAALENRVVERTAELSIALEKAQDAERLKSIFLASMSHELRTPLNAIIGFTGILLMGLTGELNPEQKEQLQIVKTNGHHLLAMINDILDISKIEAGKATLEIEPFDLIQLTKEMIANFEPQIQEKGLSLNHRLLERMTLRSDRRRLKQILMNLMSNAVKYTEEGEIRVSITKLNNDRLEIEVSDSGIGISQENMKRLFQPFQQVGMELTKSFEGTGLGLYLSQKLANLLNGEISVRSRLGKGSVFTVALPLAIGEEITVSLVDNDLGGRT